ncbi:MAG: HAMP domain-containing sensor histidine kinase [bacterium]|nr:HAMP domain-containing sensor histidine kinase [bacterium]
MPKALLRPFLIGGGALTLVFLFIGIQPLLTAGTDQALQPHAQCLLYNPSLINLYTASDLLTGLSYMAISLALVVFVRQARRELPFNWIFLAFGAFIFFCGLTHFFDIVTLWTPVYWSSGLIRLLTAIASVSTAFLLPPLIPRAMGMLTAASASEARRVKLIETNQQLGQEIVMRRRAETGLRAALERERQLNEFRGQVIMRISHEFRTPLAIAQTASDLLKLYNHQLTEAQRLERIEKIQEEIRYMTGLLQDIVTVGRFSRHQHPFSSVTVNMAAMVRTVIDDQKLLIDGSERFAAHTFDFAIHGEPCSEALLDRALMQQICTNLIQNAVKYSPEHSTVSVNLTCSDEEIMLQVSDQGIGIPAKDLEQIFDSFYRGSNVGETPGTGIGLSVVKLAVELHGGTIRVDSQVGQGTTFTVRLPRLGQNRETDPESAPRTA